MRGLLSELSREGAAVSRVEGKGQETGTQTPRGHSDGGRNRGRELLLFQMQSHSQGAIAPRMSASQHSPTMPPPSPQSTRTTQLRRFLVDVNEGRQWFERTITEAPEYRLTRTQELASVLVESLVGDSRTIGGLWAEPEAAESGVSLLAMLAAPEFFEHGAYAVGNAGGIRVASRVLREFGGNATIVQHALKLLVSD